jgi:hypothetical protein
MVRVAGVADHVRRENHVWQCPERAVERQWLDLEAIKRRTCDATASQRLVKRLLINDLAARGVHQDRGFLH